MDDLNEFVEALAELLADELMREPEEEKTDD